MPDRLSLECDFASRFVYWTGASGRRYIHTVYEAGACPPLPGAVYIAVARTTGDRRRALAIGRFPGDFALSLARPAAAAGSGDAVTEIHVHLLADSEDERRIIADDLTRGLGLCPAAAGGGHRRQRCLISA